MEEQRNKLIFKVSLLSISLFLMMAPQIASALPLMYHAFPGVDKAGVEMLSTVPNFGIMFGLLISPILVKYLGQKVTILIGLIGTLITGTFPMYCFAYTPILISRFLIGLSIGLFNSLAVSLIPQFYSDDENKLAQMVGIQNVMGNVGAAIASFLVSYLVTISWHAAFAIYFLVIPALILFTLFVKLPKPEHHKVVTKKKTSQHVNGSVIKIAILMFLIFTFYMTITFKLPILIVQGKLGSTSQAALVAGFSTLIAIPIGACFGIVFKKIHDLIFPTSYLFVTLGFLGISLAQSMPILLGSIVLLSIGFGLGVPYMYNWLDWSAPVDSVNLATTVVLVLVNIGCFVSPTIIDGITNLCGSSSPRVAMLVSTVAFGLITVYAFIHYLSVHKKSKSEA